MPIDRLVLLLLLGLSSAMPVEATSGPSKPKKKGRSVFRPTLVLHDSLRGGGVGHGQLDAALPDPSAREVYPGPNDTVAVDTPPSTDLAYLQRAAIYPAAAKRSGIEGTVHVRALIGRDGSVVRSFVSDRVHTLLDDAALRAVRISPWKPALRDGTPVAAWVTMPVRFVLQ